MRLFLLSLLLLLPAPLLHAQDLRETLSRVGEAYARAYTQPFADAAGANLNTGLFHTARVGNERFGLNVYLGVKAFGTLIPEAGKRFDLILTDSVTLEQRIGSTTIPVDVPGTVVLQDAPTIFGETQAPEATIVVDHDTTFHYLGLVLPAAFDTTMDYATIGGLVDLPALPSAVLQLGLGTVLGTDVMVRWLPQTTVSDFGGVALYGVGVRHSLAQYVPLLPFDLAVQAAWQRVTADDATGSRVVELETVAANVQVSKRLGVLTLYGGLQREESTVTIRYTLDPSVRGRRPVPIHFTLKGINKTRGIAGLSLLLGPVTFNADAGLGHMTTFSTGLGLTF
ncbi:MAG: hypothetical protein KatS3mg043_0766 [Rhodothermaceae bacterium]|nr:MAG: hypothetical protein KatS3mg043_0766 [Rhodothermaceae bacterium]